MVVVADFIANTKADPRPYQERVVNKAYDCLTTQGMRSVLIESPTGSGKTIMALLTSLMIHQHDNLRLGWVAMRRHLLKQVEHENTLKGFNLPLHYISMFDKDPPTDIDLLVVDEAQHDVTSSMAHLYAKIKPKRILGLSATPFRADRVKLCFDSVIKDAGIPTLIRDGYLAPYHHFTIPKWGVDEVVQLYLAEQKRWGKSIMYFHRLAQCAEAQDKLTRAGITCDTVSGSSDTDQQLVEFHDGKLQVMLNCMKLTEGFDCPDLQTVFLRPSCKSVTIQMAGRVLRKHPKFGFKQIVQCEKTPYPFPKTALAALQHTLTNGEWRTLEVNPHIEDVTQRTIRALAHIKVTMPEFITKQLLKGPKGMPRRSRRQRPAVAADGSMPGLANLDPAGDGGANRRRNELTSFDR